MIPNIDKPEEFDVMSWLQYTSSDIEVCNRETCEIHNNVWEKLDQYAQGNIDFTDKELYDRISFILSHEKTVDNLDILKLIKLVKREREENDNANR